MILLKFLQQLCFFVAASKRTWAVVTSLQLEVPNLPRIKDVVYLFLYIPRPYLYT